MIIAWVEGEVEPVEGEVLVIGLGAAVEAAGGEEEGLAGLDAEGDAVFGHVEGARIDVDEFPGINDASLMHPLTGGAEEAAISGFQVEIWGYFQNIHGAAGGDKSRNCLCLLFFVHLGTRRLKWQDKPETEPRYIIQE